MKVLAVVVTNGVTTHLASTLRALAAQSRLPQHVAVFDWGDGDSGAAVENIWDGAAPSGPATCPPLSYARVSGANLGAVVRAGLAQLQHDAIFDHEPDEKRQWLWLLHDDSPPQSAALGALLTAVELSPSAAIAGCKQVGLSGRSLISVGYTTSRFGRRLTGIEDGEVDQGQHDHRDDVFAVGTAGMLIRTDAWRELDGPDHALGPYMDGQDLSRRARLAGHRTIVVPDAVVRHARASLSGTRAEFYRRRQEFIHFQIVAAPLVLVPFILLIALGAGIIRAVGRILLKEPAMITAELRAPLAVWAAPIALARGRSQARRSSRLPRRALRPLQATWREVYQLERDRRQQRAAVRRSLIIRDELDIAEAAQRSAARRGWLTLTLVAAVSLTLAVLGPLITAGEIAGGALAPSQATLGELWRAATGLYVDTGFGLEAPANPLLIALVPPAALGAVFGLNLGAVVTALVLLALPLAALTAWAASGALTRSPLVRFWAALAWVTAPAAQFAIGEGRLGALMAHTVLPLVFLGAIRAVGVGAADTPAQRRPDGSVAAAAGGALALAGVVASAPALLPAALVLVLIGTVIAGRKWARILLMALPSLVLVAPFVVYAITNEPALLAADPGRLVPADAIGSFANAQVPAWQLLTGFSSDPIPVPGLPGGIAGVIPLVAGGLIAGLALFGLMRATRFGAIARFSWLVTALGIATALAQNKILWVDDLRAWSGTGSSLAWIGLLGAVIALSARLKTRLANRSFGWPQLAAGVGSALALAVPLLFAVTWSWQVRTEVTPLALVAESEIRTPAVVAQEQRSATQTRALLLDVAEGDTVEYRLFNRPVADLVDEALTGVVEPLDDLDLSLARAVAEISATGSGSAVEDVARLAISDILLLPAPPGVVDPRADLIATLDATAGLERVTENHYGILWRVNPADNPVAWARIESANEPRVEIAANAHEIDIHIGEEGGSRTLVLAQRASENWHATLNGHPLRSVSTQDGLQAFDVPTEGGHLEVAHKPAAREPWIWGTALIVVVTVLLAIPLRRRRGGLR